jgi:hypothetical protein
MQSHPDAHATLAQLRDTLTAPASSPTEVRLLARVPQFVDLLKTIGHGHLSLHVEAGQVVRLDVLTSET